MKLNRISFGLATGIFLGLVIFFVTACRLLMGGTGQVLTQLEAFFIGYKFSYLGGLIGFLWGLVYGFIAGWFFALIYNLFTKKA